MHYDCRCCGDAYGVSHEHCSSCQAGHCSVSEADSRPQGPLLRALKTLQAESENYDTETAHINADHALCELLESLGYGDVVSEYRKISKWYA